MKRFYVPFAGLLALLLWAVPISAADQPDLKIETATVAVFQELVDYKLSTKSGVVETLRPEGKVLVAVSAVVLPQWTDKISNARVDAKDIRLVTGSGEERMVGYFEHHGQFRVDSHSFSTYRRSDWKEKQRQVIFSGVFAVPQGTKSGVFKLGKASANLQMPKAAETPPQVLDTVSVAVLGATFVDEIRSEKSVGPLKPKPVVVYTNPNGKILAVKVKVSPKEANGDTDDHFFWNTSWLSIVTDKGHFSHTIGEMFMGGVSDSVSHNLNRGSDGGWGSTEATMYFAVPDGVKSFKLLYSNQPAADGSAS